MTYVTIVHKDARSVYRKMLGLDDIADYKGWTSIFNPTSTYRSSWEKGAAIQFIGVDGEGKEGGMVGRTGRRGGWADGVAWEERLGGLLGGETRMSAGWRTKLSPSREKGSGGGERET